MATGQPSGVIQHLRRALLLRDGAGLTDGQLLEDYISRRDEAALAALVQRHGPMVWGVCRRVLGNYHDAEDAFQATFLVLVRKAAAIASPELLANWLYGVAHQTAIKARSTVARRKVRERQVTEMPEPAVVEQDLWDDLQPLLDQELSRLPDISRVVIVLCDLEGKTRKEAARHLDLPEGTVGSRLARARVLLAKRLSERGVTLSGGALAAVLAQNVASAGVPDSVVSSTISAASLFAAGLVSVKVAALTEGVLKAMLMSKLKAVVAVVLVLGFVGTGATVLSCRTAAAQGDPSGAKPPADPAQLRVQVLIGQLDDDKFQKREQATKELRRLGRAIIPQLESALERAPTREARRRLEQLLDGYRVRLERYTNRAAFLKRLKDQVREVNFDDLDTSKDDVVAFAADRYARKHGIVITGQGGQYAGRTFGYPGDYPPVSAPNTYAPGPVAKRDAAAGAGGSRTDVSFTVGEESAAVVAFAAVFLDADYPGIGPSSLSAFDRRGKPLGDPNVVEGGNGSQVFCGVVAADAAGNLVPAISRVRLVNGSNWPGVDAGEGVTLDDFLFTDPVAAGKVRRSTQRAPGSGTMLVLQKWTK